MNYALIRKNDIANGPGVRVSLFVSGCRHHCKGCFNEETWDFSYGTPFTEDTAEEILKALDRDYITGLTVLGGEPMEPENQGEVGKLLARVKKAYPNKTVWCFSGFTFETQLLPLKVGNPETLRLCLDNIDTLVDGKFVESLKDPSLLFRGSSNQNVIDVQKSLKENRMVPMEGTWKRTMGSGNILEN